VRDFRLLPPPDPDGDYVRECVLYLRKSKGRAGIGRQRRDGYALAARLEWRIVAEFEDADTTAFAMPGEARAVRDDYTEMLATLQRCRRPAPLGVIGWHADRLHRDPGEVETFIAVCSGRRHPVETVKSGGYELWTPMGRKRIRQDAVEAAYEVDHLIERVTSQKDEAAREGRWLGGPRPFGWRAQRLSLEDDDKILVLQPVEAEAMRWAAQQVLLGASSRSIAAEWNRRGLRRRTGNLLDAAEVRRVLLRPRNAGLMVHRGQIIETELPGGKAEWPAILDEDTWRAVVHILKSPGRGGGHSTSRKWLGSNLFLCGVCTASADYDDNTVRTSTQSGGGKTRNTYIGYRCRTDEPGHVVRSAEPVDAYVTEVILERLSRPDALSLLVADDAPDVEGMRARLAVQQAQLAEWRQLAEDGEVTPVAFARAEQGILRRVEGIKGEMAAAVRSPLLHELVHVEDLRAYWESKDLVWRRAVVDQFVTVTLLKGNPGRPAGWKLGESYFDTRLVRITWKKHAVAEE
jgi:site-specific DNA recombinase